MYLGLVRRTLSVAETTSMNKAVAGRLLIRKSPSVTFQVCLAISPQRRSHASNHRSASCKMFFQGSLGVSHPGNKKQRQTQTDSGSGQSIASSKRVTMNFMVTVGNIPKEALIQDLELLQSALRISSAWWLQGPGVLRSPLPPRGRNTQMESI